MSNPNNKKSWPKGVVGITEHVSPCQSEAQVYGCGMCQHQGHRLMEDNDIICGSCICDALSQFCWYEPPEKPVDYKKRVPRLKTAVVDKRSNYVCRRCGHNHFHLHESGTITCYRCRHAVLWKWWLPKE